MKYDSKIGAGFHRWHQGTYTPAQELAMADFTSQAILNSGSYRSGKSEGMVRMGVRHAVSFPNAKIGCFRNFQASIKTSTMLSFLELVHPTWVSDWSNSELILTFKNGSSVMFAGVDNADKIGSIELTMALLDEAHEINEESRTMLTGRLSGDLVIPKNFDDLTPELKAYVMGTKDLRQTLLACNPKSKGHDLYKTFIDTPLAGHKAYTSNSLANPNLPPSYLLTQLSQYVRDPLQHGQEWLLEQIRQIRAGEADPTGVHLAPFLTVFGQRNLLGQWVSADGAIWPIDPDRHFTEEPMREYDGFMAGLDFGYNNPRIVIAKYANSGEYQTIDYWHEQQSTPQDLVEAMVAFERQYALDHVWCPHDSPGIMRELKLRLEHPGAVKRAKNQVLAGINSVSTLITQGRLTFLNPPLLFRNEMTGYEWKPGKDEPVKVDDHYPDSLRYMCHSHKYRNRV